MRLFLYGRRFFNIGKGMQVNNQFKNRLVGVIFVVVCVVFFLPWLINGKKKVCPDKFVTIPIRPDVKKHTLTLEPVKKNLASDTNNQIADPAVVESEVASPKVAKGKEVVAKNKKVADDKWQIKEIANTSPHRSAASKKKKINSRKKTGAKNALPIQKWTIQLGAFKREKNINTLLKTLNRAGFQVHTMPLQVIDGQITRVFVGPDVSKSKLEKELPVLKKITKLTGHLVPFKTVPH